MKPTFCQCCERVYEVPEDYLKGTSKFRVCPKAFLWFECSCGSGLVLKKGEYEWYSPTLRMSEAAATIFQNVQEIRNIPLVPTAIMTLQTVISDENSSSTDIKKALKQAPNIAMGVLRIANNLRASSIPEFTNLEHAISFVGRKTLNELILTETLQEFDFKTNFFAKDAYWQESILTGKICEYIAEHFARHLSKDEAYIAGCLCNIGKVVSAICFPNVTDDVARQTVNPRRPRTWSLGEDNIRAYSHVTLGEIAASLWGFPDYVVHAISYHHVVPEKVTDLPLDVLDFMDNEAEQRLATLQQVVAMGNQFTHWVLLQPTRMDEPLLNSYAKKFGLSDEQINQLADQLMKLKELKAS
ncbi:MAG TPA: HDOD domain-containing protein [Oligoflexus sp.]|uniref:HDOD domain-containing protein n=1 Tax=Oligoflexus sp. TaxID=1971216 RepID=UPI002D3DC483|nr:HDOD domain-containing protein [Oligoflexus sp.]HYX38185.1 HDOD domain-containing protein [Oligoflexus sp.]